eukprot:4433278-Pleurochrysis_carterae.AAC.2
MLQPPRYPEKTRFRTIYLRLCRDHRLAPWEWWAGVITCCAGAGDDIVHGAREWREAARPKSAPAQTHTSR